MIHESKKIIEAPDSGPTPLFLAGAAVAAATEALAEVLGAVYEQVDREGDDPQLLTLKVEVSKLLAPPGYAFVRAAMETR